MGSVALEVVRVVIDLVRRAFDGDAGAQAQLRDILPPRLHTDMVAEVQDRLDRAKFGPRGDEPTGPVMVR